MVHHDTWILDLHTSPRWWQGPNLLTGRQFHTCSLITRGQSELFPGQKEVVVVGGQNQNDFGDDCGTLNSVEIVNVATRKVRQGELSERTKEQATNWKSSPLMKHHISDNRLFNSFKFYDTFLASWRNLLFSLLTMCYRHRASCSSLQSCLSQL